MLSGDASEVRSTQSARTSLGESGSAAAVVDGIPGEDTTTAAAATRARSPRAVRGASRANSIKQMRVTVWRDVCQRVETSPSTDGNRRCRVEVGT